MLRQINRLVLKAEAMHVVGLKRITAKQLALSSQTLTAVQVLIPSVAARCSEALTERQKVMLTEFEKVEGDYRKHRQGIIDKLVAIMRDVWSRSSMVSVGCGWGPGRDESAACLLSR